MLFELGLERVNLFCDANEIEAPKVATVSKADWQFDACAYYRSWIGIRICLDKCAKPNNGVRSRNWNWPGNVTDRTPYGVLCHELGHHCDCIASGDCDLTYHGDYSRQLCDDSGEKPLTSYCPNPAEWFAEHFRLFVTNPDLLKRLRPKTYELISAKWKPVETRDFADALGEDVPWHILNNVLRKL